MGRIGDADPSRSSGSHPSGATGIHGESCGAEVVQMLGAAEHRNARIRGCVSEKRSAATTQMGRIGDADPSRSSGRTPQERKLGTWESSW
jgi:hypothetical protein